jgi:hypothetical protein
LIATDSVPLTQEQNSNTDSVYFIICWILVSNFFEIIPSPVFRRVIFLFDSEVTNPEERVHPGQMIDCRITKKNFKDFSVVVTFVLI